MKYIRTEKGVYEFTDEMCVNQFGHIAYKDRPFICIYGVGNNVINQADTIEELCDEFVFNSDVSSYIIDKKYIEHCKTTTLKIYKENDETDYVKAMHPKIYGAIWTSKGLIYVAKMNENGELVLI